MARSLLVSLFALNCYRAATQSFTHDEALYFQFFIGKAVHGLFEDRSRVPGCYGDCIADPHFLFTLLMRFCSASFGNSAFSLRLPSVAAGGLYFVSIYRLCRIAFRSPLLFLAGVVLMAGNPLVLDFMVAARGYGLALALFVYSLLQVAIYLTRDVLRAAPGFWRGPLMKAGLTAGLSVTANHTLAPPCLALSGTLVLLLWRRNEFADCGRRWIAPAISFFGPLFAVAYIFLLVSPFLRIFGGFFSTMEENRLTNDSIFGSLRDLTQYSLAHNAGVGGLNSDASALELVRQLIGFAMVPGAVLVAACTGWRRLCQPAPEGLSELSICGALFSTVTIGAALVVIYLRLALNVALPHDRMGLYFLPLGGFALVAAGGLLLQESGPWRRVGQSVLSSAAVVVLFYGCQLNWTHFAIWKYDADSSALMERIAVRAANYPGRPLVVGGSWYYEPTVNYYRITRHWTWMAPMRREPSDGVADFYLLTTEDNGVAAKLGLESIATGRLSGTLLAASRQ